MNFSEFESNIGLVIVNDDITKMYQIISEPNYDSKTEVWSGFSDEFGIDRAIELYKNGFRNVNDLVYVILTNMTSITRYVRYDRSKHPNLTEGQSLDRSLEYKELAMKAVDSILNYINGTKEQEQMKDKWINIRCTEQERQDITEQAKEHNMSVAQFIRYLVAKERKEREK